MAEETVFNAKLKGLTDLIETKFAHVQRQLDNLASAIEKLAETTITETIYLEQARRLTEAVSIVKENTQRLDQLEAVIRVLRLLGSVGVAIIIAILIALATGRGNIVWR